MPEPQDSIYIAGGVSAYYHAELIRNLPKWRQWLIRKLSPPRPCIRAEIPPAHYVLSEPLKAPPGVAITGLSAELAPEVTADA